MELSLVSPAQVPLSTEENDLIHRSSKKIKNGAGSSYGEEWPELGNARKSQRVPGLTFAEKLQGISRDEKMEEDSVANLSDDSLSDKDDNEPICVITEDPKRNFPTFSFSEKMRKRLCRVWKQVVIVKLLGKNIGYKLLLSILQKLWAKKGILNLINIGNGFFVAKFSNKEDHLKALTGGNKASVAAKQVGDSGANGVAGGNRMEVSETHAGVVTQSDAGSWKEEGSRFGVLAEEGNGGDDTQTMTGPDVVRDVAVEGADLRRPISEPLSRARKGETKKMIRKEVMQMGKVVYKFRAKRGEGEANCLREKRAVEDDDSPEKAPRVDLAPDPTLGLSSYGPLEANGVESLSGLEGKFWANSACTGANLDMDLDGECENSNGTVVPDSQRYLVD
ncbi:hypothetical protein K1719_027545 [Acacia pycnantha]|nr:hypothetical protein K1719_027545 [Acacia pycnantha]